MFNAFTGIIRGRVQGVGFRLFTQKTANELQIKGWVRNLPDGTVEVWAQGPLLALEQFMHSLEVGPVGGWVEAVQFQWFQDDQELSRFEIRG